MHNHLERRDDIKEKLRQLAADVNDLNAHEESGARPTSMSELAGLPLATLLVWAGDVERRRIEAGLPAHVRT